MAIYRDYSAVKTMLISVSVLLGCIIYYRYYYDGTELVQSTVDGKWYRVRIEPGNQRKADLLAILNIKLNLIVESLQDDSRYSQNVAVQRLIYNWNQGVTIKEIGKMETDAAYVINKKHMSFCLQENPGNNKKTIEDINLMTYVGIHELAHVMSYEIGHGDEFISNFEFLLNYAKQLKYYDPLLHKELPLYIQLDKLNTADNYCGVSLINSIN
jgi:hypothetical protein